MTAKQLENKKQTRLRRKRRVRANVFGTAEKPRMSVFRSNKHFYAQAINDVNETTLVAVDGAKAGLKANREDVKKLAADMAAGLKEKNIETIIFDRNGYLYHGVVANFADALREAGLKF